MKNSRWLWVAAAAAALGVAATTLHPPVQAKADAQAAVALPVGTAPARLRDVEQTLDALGTVVPTRSVKLRPQVAGQLLATHFNEGGKVAKGQVLAVIDSRELAARLKQAQGVLQRDQALRKNARLDLGRDKAAVRDGSATQQALDTQQSLVEQLDGTVLADQGAIDELKVQIGYTRLRSPVAGRIGLRQIDAGNIVGTDDASVISTVDTVKPIEVAFTLPQEQIQRVLGAWRRDKTLAVSAYDRDKRHLLARGKLFAIDNHVDPTTGTISLKARFANEHGRLIPNEFVNARLLVGTLHDALVVPAAAVRHGRGGDFLYTVGADNRAIFHRIDRGPASRDDLVVEASDLHAGDVVVVEGADRLENGVLVVPHPHVAKARPRGGEPGAATPEDAAASSAVLRAAPEPEPASGSREADDEAPASGTESRPETRRASSPGAGAPVEDGAEADGAQ
ncbi:MAG: efflux RND transporter periplasmic adaptor subunit [Burkholderiaceae bacterium]